MERPALPAAPFLAAAVVEAVVEGLVEEPEPVAEAEPEAEPLDLVSPVFWAGALVSLPPLVLLAASVFPPLSAAEVVSAGAAPPSVVAGASLPVVSGLSGPAAVEEPPSVAELSDAEVEDSVPPLAEALELLPPPRLLHQLIWPLRDERSMFLFWPSQSMQALIWLSEVQ